LRTTRGGSQRGYWGYGKRENALDLSKMAVGEKMGEREREDWFLKTRKYSGSLISKVCARGNTPRKRGRTGSSEKRLDYGGEKAAANQIFGKGVRPYLSRKGTKYKKTKRRS